ncbi:hypothetical protein C0J52_09943 [Blattella germanica]|nr:hypothetical protein C0J52_09943 [Blattella germanica]
MKNSDLAILEATGHPHSAPMLHAEETGAATRIGWAFAPLKSTVWLQCQHTTPASKNKINKFHSYSMTLDEVTRAIALFEDGHSIHYIANVLGVARSTVHDAIKRYQETVHPIKGFHEYITEHHMRGAEQKWLLLSVLFGNLLLKAWIDQEACEKVLKNHAHNKAYPYPKYEEHPKSNLGVTRITKKVAKNNPNQTDQEKTEMIFPDRGFGLPGLLGSSAVLVTSSEMTTVRGINLKCLLAISVTQLAICSSVESTSCPVAFDIDSDEIPINARISDQKNSSIWSVSSLINVLLSQLLPKMSSVVWVSDQTGALGGLGTSLIRKKQNLPSVSTADKAITAIIVTKRKSFILTIESVEENNYRYRVIK